jgi:uncharacterized repeat protein (TIGR01451 family)
MIARPSCKRVAVTLLLASLLLGGYVSGVVAQGEPSPVEVQLTAPQQAGPGQVIDVLIKYNAVDPNAGAVLNYNLFGPAMIWTRIPEPPNPLVNTWGPKFNPVQGTIKIQVKIDEGTDGQVLRHQVEVKWGPKFVKYIAETKIKYVPPTPTPTPTPRPQPRPTQPPPTPVVPALDLTSVTFVSTEGKVEPLSTAKANQEIALDVLYTSSGTVENVVVRVWFEPDLVNIDGLERTGTGYVLTVPSLAAAPEEAPLFDLPLKGRIRPYAEGGEQYVLRAFVEASAPEGALANTPGLVETAPLEVEQDSLVAVRATVDSSIVRTGGSIIVHAVCDNPGQVTVRDVKMRVGSLPEGFVIHPAEQVIDYVSADGGSQERVFTIRTPEDREENIDLKVIATFGETVVESEPLFVQVASPVPLVIDVSADSSTVRAGQSAYYAVTCTNNGQFTAHSVTARLIDTTGNLGVLLQDLGDIQPRESRDLVFVVEISPDFPADIVTSLVAQTISEDGTISEAPPVSLTVVCVPSFELLVQPPVGKLEDGQSAEAIVVVRNISQCTARDVEVSISGLPEAFVVPLPQNIAELAPGGVRHLTFNFSIPERYPQGDVSFVVHAADSLGTEIQAPPATFSIGGVSLLFTIVFGILALLAIAAIVVGLAFYFRQS